MRGELATMALRKGRMSLLGRYVEAGANLFGTASKVVSIYKEPKPKPPPPLRISRMTSLNPKKAFERALTPPGTGALEARGIQSEARDQADRAAADAANAAARDAASIDRAKLANLRAAEEAKAEDERIKSIQRQLGVETTQRRAGQFGFRSLLGPLTSGRGLRSLLGSG